jgi:transporter family protein
MRPHLLALLTAVAWGVGGYFEKKGLHQGNLAPQVGAFLRTAVALLVLGLASGTELRQLAAAPARSWLAIGLGGGLAAGGLGILCFYAALRSAPIQQVMPIAFTAPLFGALAAMLLGGEAISLRTAAGMALTLLGIALIASR